MTPLPKFIDEMDTQERLLDVEDFELAPAPDENPALAMSADDYLCQYGLSGLDALPKTVPVKRTRPARILRPDFVSGVVDTLVEEKAIVLYGPAGSGKSDLVKWQVRRELSARNRQEE